MKEVYLLKAVYESTERFDWWERFVEIAPFLTVLIALVTVIISISSHFQGRKLKRNEYVKQLIEMFRNDEEISDAAHMTEYEDDWYKESFHSKTQNCKMKIVDKYLGRLSYICHLIKRRAIKGNEIILFEYKIVSALTSESVQNYLWNLHHDSEDKYGVKHTTYDLIWYGIKNELIDEDFMNKHNSSFKKYATTYIEETHVGKNLKWRLFGYKKFRCKYLIQDKFSKYAIFRKSNNQPNTTDNGVGM